MTEVRRTLTNVQRAALSKWRRKRGVHRRSDQRGPVNVRCWG